MMLRRIFYTCMMAGVWGGCDGLDQVVVILENNGEFPVEVDIYIADFQEIPEFLLTTTGEKIEMTVPAGGVSTFLRSCDELQAIIIESADLRVIGDVGPNSETDVLRDGDDFGCGAILTFTFDHPDLPTSLDIKLNVL